MKNVARLARYVWLFCLAGIALMAYFFAGTGGAASFWVMFGLFVGFCLCVPIMMLDDVLENIGWRKPK